MTEPSNETKLFQISVQNSLRRIFNESRGEVVEKEWISFKRQGTIYSPRVDIVVGPFAIEEGQNRIFEFNDMARDYSGFIDRCIAYFRTNVSEFQESDPSGFVNLNIPRNYQDFCERAINSNARCFIAMEIEKTGTRKHMLGDLINAACLGRVGIIVAWDRQTMRAFLKMLVYWGFLRSVGKLTFDCRNTLIITKDQLSALLNIQNSQ